MYSRQTIKKSLQPQKILPKGRIFYFLCWLHLQISVIYVCVNSLICRLCRLALQTFLKVCNPSTLSMF